MTKWQEKRNKAIAKRRCGIEHIFGAIKHFGGDIVRSIGLARCKKDTDLCFCFII
ncbi:MAG: transposase [Akkermansia sp.]|nr:transposase [Akkermansia sp.]